MAGKDLKTNNRLVKKQNQNDLRKLEQDFVNAKIDEMQSYLEQRKNEIIKELINFGESHRQPTKWDKDGIPVEYGVMLKPLVINNYFFKSICPIGSVEPIYNPEKLALVFEYYNYILSEINDKLGDYPSSLTSFCKLAGITTNTLRNLRASDDLNMRIIVDKIYDQVGDDNITMGQLGITKERSTLFKLRSQNEVTEAERPSVSINITEKVDKDAIENKISKYSTFLQKKK